MRRFHSRLTYGFGILSLVSGAVAFCGCGSRMQAQKKNVAELLNEITTGANDRAKIAAIHELATRPDSSTVTALIVALQDRSTPVRKAAVAALSRFNDARAKDALWDATRDTSQSVDFQVAAASALAHLHDARSADPLIQALPFALSKASAGLMELGQAAVPPLTDALHRAEIRDTVSKILASIGAPAVDPLIQLLHNDYDKYARLAAARTLGEIDDPHAANALTETLRAPNTEFVAAVYRFLIRRGQPGAESALVAALNAYGNPAMAEDFASSGNAALKTAAESWAGKSGFPLGERTSELPQVHWASVDPKRGPGQAP